MKRKVLNAVLGFAAGIVSIPFAAVAWPIFLSWYMFNETDEKEFQ